MNIDIKRLVVKYNHKVVGYLETLSNQTIAFQYDKNWVENGFSISPFHLPLTDKVYISKSEHFNGLFGVFFDSLPDGWGELLMRRMLAKKGINFDKISALTKLSLINDNGLGALTYEPTQSEKNIGKYSDLDTLATEIKQIFENSATKNNFDEIYELGGASGGARPKVHITMDEEDWIVKFSSSIDPKGIGKLEYQANLLALKAKINVNQCKLFPSKNHSGYFGAKRFDKIGKKRIHMISLSALLETTPKIPNLDYSHLFQVIQKICIDQDDLYEAYKRMCFNVLYENKDDHGKNTAFLYDDNKGGYKLSPFYDITQTKHKFEHEMTVLGNGKPTETDLIDIAKLFNLSLKKIQMIIKEIKETISNEA
ncbi:type II toxin-antitoxin system HipA family toxin [Mariniplasma anaerobium]|uniref:Toxin HipA n=1 Tax=Mariniplasma anaerobium TaxID=2735436 RepID=A0A7U9XV66_9MOLU|nr:type II toxin-antitoxin system HipA family toxin [Mariniplasma anaerobium]BCR36151.1 toxin HipA [Mariniplasma anaerobium]